MKDSFILYNSFYEPIKALKNEQLGKLLRSIFDYTINGTITQDSEIIVAFMFIKNQIDIDSKKWEEERKKRSEAGRLGGIQRAINQNQTLSNAKQTQATLSNAKQNQANQGDNVNVNVNVNDNVINNNKKTIQKKPTIEEIENYCKERNNNVNANAFYDFYESKDWYIGKNKMKDWKACVRTWERNEKGKSKTPDWFNKDIKTEEPSQEELEQLEGFLKEFQC